LAVGARHAVRVDVDLSAPSAAIACALASATADHDIVCCGDWSLDRGSGAVPAFLAHELGAAQGLGCTRARLEGRTLRAERRLDRGRREHLRLTSPAVLSFEGGSAELRRAGIRAVLAARDRAIETVPGPDWAPTSHVEESGPYRPRSRPLAPPAGPTVRDRLVALTGAGAETQPATATELSPRAAAERLLDTLGEWGVIPDDDVDGQ